jgi:hypothetical protein
MDGTSWTQAAEASGTTAATIVTFPPVQAKFVRLSLTTTTEDAPAWSIQNLRIFAESRPGETAARSQ